MPYSDEECISVSGLQHLAFCKRQWGLIHLDQEWAENRLTAEGKTLHERVDEGYREFRKGLRQYSGLHVRNHNYGLYGRLDVLEASESSGPSVDIPLLGLSGNWELHPVEFKRGKPKQHDADTVQLCAQTLCLEEMTGLTIGDGSVFYGEIRRRIHVPITDALRMRTIELADEAHQLLALGKLPVAVVKSDVKSGPSITKASCKKCNCEASIEESYGFNKPDHF
jgi:CRISPR-associated exonuclease Cas4